MYFKNLSRFESVSTGFQIFFWLLVCVFTIIFNKRIALKSFLHIDELFIPLIALRYLAPLLIGISEAWTNALMLGLFNKLQKERVGDGVEIYKADLKKQKKTNNKKWFCLKGKQ